MKKCYSLINIIGVIMLITSCTKERYEVVQSMEYSFGGVRPLSKSADLGEYSVSHEDVLNYVGKNSCILDINEYRGKSGSVAIYAVNFKNGGYKLVSGDKRANISVGESNVGYMDFRKLEGSAKDWIESYSNLIEDINVCDSLTDFMKYNVSTWEFINGRMRPQTKASRYVYLVNYTETSYNSIDKGPLVLTQWGQSSKVDYDHYWNKYCPWVSESMTGERCPVGCVAVAGGQFAYYFKDYPNVSIQVPISASCSGYYADYVQSFSSSLTEIGELPLNYYETNASKIENARVFLAYLGHTINMDYTPDRSGAPMALLANELSVWGINNLSVPYADTTVRRVILRNEPVVVSAYRMSGTERYGHAWLIDGYRKIKILRRNFYYISDVELSDDEVSELTMADCNSYDEWQMPDVIQYHMNWGWDGSNDGWYDHDTWAPSSNRDYNLDKNLIIRY